MNVLLTGVNGFVGRKIGEILSKGNDKIIGIGRLPVCKCKTINEYHMCDISKEEEVSELFAKVPQCDVVVHIAAKISFDNFDANIIDCNIKGTLNIGLFALKSNVKQIVYISSAYILSKPEVLPITEINNQINPKSLYHLTKYVGEKIFDLPEFINMDITILRIAAPVSPDMPSNRMISLFLNKALRKQPITLHGKGNRVQNYVDTRDVAKAVLCAINRKKAGIFSIGGHSLSNYDIAKFCNQICNSDAGINYSGQMDPEDEYNWTISNEKSKEQLGYFPDYSVNDTIIEMMSLMKKDN